MTYRFSLAAAVWVLCCAAHFPAAAQTLQTERMTWQEVKAAQDKGLRTALIPIGSTEQNGPHMALGKHNRIATYVAEQVATALGDTLVYPVLPFAPTGSISPPAGHMRYPGSISLRTATYAAVVEDLALSAMATGFKQILLYGDHGDGQTVLEATAKALDAQYQARGVRFFYLGDAYGKSFEQAKQWLAQKGLPVTDHAGIVDTSELMFVSQKTGQTAQMLRPAQFAHANKSTGSDGGVARASVALGEQFIGYKVAAALAQVRALRRGAGLPAKP